jgi:hypothetical protein
MSASGTRYFAEGARSHPLLKYRFLDIGRNRRKSKAQTQNSTLRMREIWRAFEHAQNRYRISVEPRATLPLRLAAPWIGLKMHQFKKAVRRAGARFDPDRPANFAREIEKA